MIIINRLRYGVIGCGNIATTKHLPGYYEQNDKIEIVALCDINKDKLKISAEKYNINTNNTYSDYKELLKRDDIDFISVCTPNYLHATIAIEAMKAGKHVHCEKPMAMKQKEAKEMISVSEETNKVLMIGLNNRFTAENQFVKKYIEEGNLGEIYHVKCGWQRRACAGAFGWFTDKAQSGGGPLIDLGVHYIDLVMYFMNYPELYSVVAKTHSKLVGGEKGYLFTHDNSKMTDDTKFDVEDLTVGFIELKNQTTVDFEVSWASHIEKESIFYQFYGTKGGLRFSNDTGTTGVKIFTIIDDAHCDITPKINKRLTEVNEFATFIDCIHENKKPNISILSQNLEMMKMIDAIYESANTRKQIVF